MKTTYKINPQIPNQVEIIHVNDKGETLSRKFTRDELISTIAEKKILKWSRQKLNIYRRGLSALRKLKLKRR